MDEIKPHSVSSLGFYRWIWMTCLLIALGVGGSILVSIHLDSFGLHGRRPVPVYALERYSKYLLCFRYIPENFDSVLIGNSVAASWDTSDIHGMHVYNLALRGSEISEQKILVDKILETGNLRSIFVVIYPTLTSKHGRQSAYMTPHDYRASFGSLQNLIVLTQALVEKLAGPGTSLQMATHKFLPSGGFDFPVAHIMGSFPLIRPDEMTVDMLAEKDLIDLISELHQKQVKIYVVIAPIYLPKREVQKKDLDAWNQSTLNLFSSSDAVVDLNDAALDPILSQHDSYPDYVHLSRTASIAVVKFLDQRISARNNAEASAGR